VGFCAKKNGRKIGKEEKMSDQDFLEFAIQAARQGASEGGVPIGGALVVDGKVLGVGYNKRVQLGSAIRHGETDCLENIGRLPASIYQKATMYTTLSPCHMCSGAILLYGIPRVVLGENETFMGAEELLRSHGVEVINLNSAECKALMATFIAEKPAVWNEDIGV
jgi:cytosine deaminase